VFRRQCFVSADAEETDGVRACVDTIGPDGICWTTDYPHPDHTWKGIASGFLDRDDISAAAKAQIIGGNAVRAYKV
jgi:hypothetical protein